MKDLTDLSFGWLYVIGRGEKHVGKHHYWRVRCRCGVEKDVPGWALRSGRITSCGCRRKDLEVRTRAALTVPKSTRVRNAKTAAKARWEEKAE